MKHKKREIDFRPREASSIRLLLGCGEVFVIKIARKLHRRNDTDRERGKREKERRIYPTLDQSWTLKIMVVSLSRITRRRKKWVEVIRGLNNCTCAITRALKKKKRKKRKKENVINSGKYFQRYRLKHNSFYSYVHTWITRELLILSWMEIMQRSYGMILW